MNQSHDMMNRADGWMHGWGGGAVWLWTGVGVLILFLLVMLIRKQAKR